MTSKVSFALLFTLFVWFVAAVPLKPEESATGLPNTDQPNAPQAHHDDKPLLPGEPHPAPPPPPPAPERRPVRDVEHQEPARVHLPQWLNKENTDKPQETTTEKRNKRASDDSDSDEDERRIENLKDEKPEAKKRPARNTQDDHHHQNPPATNQGGTTEKSRKSREASTTTQNVPSLLLQTTTEKARKARDVQSPKPIGIASLPAKIDDNTQNKESSSTTSKP